MPLQGRELGPEGLKPAFLADTSSTAEEAAEKVESITSAAKAAGGNNDLIAALKRYATQSQTFSAACEAMSFPKPICETSSPALDIVIYIEPGEPRRVA